MISFHDFYQMKFSILYLISIVVVVSGFAYYPMLIDIPFTTGSQISFWSFLVGLWFVLRDYSQKEIGHYVFFSMGIGSIVTYILNPGATIAAVGSFLAGELTDWAVYTFTKLPFHKRVLLSSIASAPVDTVVFFGLFDYLEVIPGVSIFTRPSILVGIAVKILSAVLIFGYLNNKKA